MEKEEKRKYFYGVGRRKTSSAQVRLYPNGKGNFLINNKDANKYFGGLASVLIQNAIAPLVLIRKENKFDIEAKVKGGGISSQADAIRLGIARALLVSDQTLKPTLKKAGFLTRDPRVKERKKPGLKRARKAPQYAKR